MSAVYATPAPHTPLRSANGFGNRPSDDSRPRRRRKHKTRSMIRAERRSNLYVLMIDVIFERLPDVNKRWIIDEAKKRQKVAQAKQSAWRSKQPKLSPK
jgi:hypothetical protein